MMSFDKQEELYADLINPKTYTEKEVDNLIRIAHAQGWNDARGESVVFSDTSHNNLYRLLRQRNLFNPR